MRPVVILLPLSAAVIGYFLTLQALPAAITWYALDRVSDGGHTLNQWIFESRITAASRDVVQSAPDLLYSGCIYDLSQGDVRVTVPAIEGYVSVSVFDDRGDNVMTASNRTHPDGIDLRLTPNGRGGEPGLVRTTRRGIVLERRLAHTDSDFKRADRLRRSGRCELVAGARGSAVSSKRLRART